MVAIVDSGVQAENFLRTFSAPEFLLLLLTSCRTVGLQGHAAACREDHLLMVNVSQARDLPDRGSIAEKVIGVTEF